MPRPSALQQLVGTFRGALDALGCEVPDADLERWSIEVHYAMSAGGRWFHTIEHVFEIIDGAAPIQVLAGVFHDTIYLQVDGGLPHRLKDRLGDVLADGLCVDHDPIAAQVAQVFGIKDGTQLCQVQGLNEFLSALFAARSLSGHVPDAVVTAVVACIELTLPFRPRIDGTCASDRLEARLGGLVDPESAQTIVALAQDLANRDVGNFASEDPAYFLDNTWKLLPESNAGLRASVYTIREYAEAMERMRGFFRQLDPSVVFCSHKGVPDEAALNVLCAAAAKNLAVGTRYLDAKVLAANTLLALALRTGGDAPISLFMGDLPRIQPDAVRLEHHLPQAPPPTDGDADVYRLLSVGRASEQGFDLRHSPLAAFLYSQLGAAVHGIVEELLALPPADRTGFVLARLGPALPPILKATAKLAITRQDQLARMA